MGISFYPKLIEAWRVGRGTGSPPVNTPWTAAWFSSDASTSCSTIRSIGGPEFALPTPPSSASRSPRPLERQRPTNGRLSRPRGSRRGLGWSHEIVEVGVGNIGYRTIVGHSTVDPSTVENFCSFACCFVSAATAAVGVAAVAAMI